MNDRALRNIVIGLGAKADGIVREDHFVITVASEIMAILCLADNMEDLKARLGRIIVAYDFAGQPVTADDLHATGSMAALLKDALKPNLIQTLEHTGALVHGGPFANIAHGCNSVRATKTALKLADIVVTEAGFGADLGAEKFLDIKCRMAGLKPDAVVLVATVRALKYNGGVPKDQLSVENLDALKRGQFLDDAISIEGSTAKLSLGAACLALSPCGLVVKTPEGYAPSAEANRWIDTGDNSYLAACLASRCRFFSGMIDVLGAPMTSGELRLLANAEYGMSWSKTSEVQRRLKWARELGLVEYREYEGCRYVRTPLGD